MIALRPAAFDRTIKPEFALGELDQVVDERLVKFATSLT